MPESSESRDRVAKMPFAAHVRELRRRLLISLAALVCGALVSLTFAKQILALLMRPLEAALPAGAGFVALSPFEGWLVYFRVSCAGAFILASPVVFYQAWAFAAPAFDRGRLRELACAAAASSALFLAGAAFCYGLILPHAFVYFAGMLEGSGIALMPRISDYVSLLIRLAAAFGLIFQVPLVTILITRWGIASPAQLGRARKYVVVGAFAAAAVITPPDVFTQIAVALPLVLLFEAGLAAARIMNAGRRGSVPAEAARTA